MHVVDMIGKVIFRWTVIERGENTPLGQAQWRCRCECGIERDVPGGDLRLNKSRSCGCLLGDRNRERKTHGMTNTRAYFNWNGMIQRCGNPNHKQFCDYGGRGIRVCDEWMKFENFYRDMGNCPSGKQIDRVDNDKGYCKENCHWASGSENCRNRRNNVWVEYQGKRMTLVECSEVSGVPYRKLQQRIKNLGWTIERATHDASNPQASPSEAPASHSAKSAASVTGTVCESA